MCGSIFRNLQICCGVKVKFQIAATTHQVSTYDDEDEEIRAIICVTLAATFSQEGTEREGAQLGSWREDRLACVWSQTPIPISILMAGKKFGEEDRGMREGGNIRWREREQVAITLPTR